MLVTRTTHPTPGCAGSTPDLEPCLRVEARPCLPSSPMLHVLPATRAFADELAQAAAARKSSRYAPGTLAAAGCWGTDDFASVSAILYALADEPLPTHPADVLLHRSTNRQFLDLEHQQIGNNPNAVAKIANTHTMERKLCWDGKRIMASMCVPASTVLPHGGVNFLVSVKENDKNLYHREEDDLVEIMCSLADVFNAGGRVYPDTGSHFYHAVMVEMPGTTTLPFRFKPKA